MTIAIFIDGDNISSDYCEAILAEGAKLGDVRVKSVFGRCATFAGKGWKDVAQKHGIQIYPQVNNLRGKSAADIALVIDVMKQLEIDSCDGIVIASNDTDYTALVYEIKRRGKKAYCLVTKAVNNVLMRSCDDQPILLKMAKAKVPPQPKPAAQPKPAVPPKPAARPAAKPQPKAQLPSKPAALPKAKPQPKPAVPPKPAARPVAKPQPKAHPQPQPAPQPAAKPQPKKGTYKQIAAELKKSGCRNVNAIRNKIISDYFRPPAEIDTIVKNMLKHRLVSFDVNGHATWIA